MQGQRDEGDGALHPGGRGLGDGRSLRGGEPGGDRALQHGRAREDPDGVQGWQDQIDRLEKLLHERHGSGGPTWYQYGSGIPGGHGGDRAGMSMPEGLGGLRGGDQVRMSVAGDAGLFDGCQVGLADQHTGMSYHGNHEGH